MVFHVLVVRSRHLNRHLLSLSSFPSSFTNSIAPTFSSLSSISRSSSSPYTSSLSPSAENPPTSYSLSSSSLKRHFSSPSPSPSPSPPSSSSSFIDSLPLWLRPYAALSRCDKPVGTLLLLWPCIWGTALAAPMGHLPDPVLCLTFSIGTLLCCTVL